MKCLVFLLVFFTIISESFSQYTINVQVDSMPTNRAYLYEFRGTQTQMLDSVRTTIPGNVKFSLPPDAHPGLYRIVVGPNNFWDFIFNKENIRMRTHYASPRDSLKVIESVENTLFVKYMSYFITLNRKADAISRLMTLYEKNSEFFKSLNRELMNLRMEDPQLISREIIKEHPGSYVARFLKVGQNPIVPVGLGKNQEIEYVIEHFFDETEFSDSSLIYSPPLITKIRTYFGLFEQAFPPAESEGGMIKGLDRLMSSAAVSEPVYDFILADLADGFERSEYETFFAYLTETYLLDAGCTNEERSTELAEVLASIQKTAIGNKAPEIILPLADGPVIMSDIPEKFVLVLFWASWCPHCNEILPDFKKLYEAYHPAGFEIVAISIDKEKAAYTSALAKGQYPWINYSELKGWDCSIAYDYGIRATPTMVLLDGERKIVAKPRNLGILVETLNQQGLRPIR